MSSDQVPEVQVTNTDINTTTDTPTDTTTPPTKQRIRYDREIGVFLLTGLPYCVWRAGYRQSKKQYKKYKAHRQLKHEEEKGTLPQPIQDPSFELTNMSRLNSSASSIGSASLAEMERELENDEEFQRFMQTQKEVFLSHQVAQRRSGGGLGSTKGGVEDGMPTTPGIPELPGAEPVLPDYEAAMARFRNSVDDWTSKSLTSELDVDGTVRLELPTKSRSMESPVGIMCELPADMPPPVVRPVELPAGIP